MTAIKKAASHEINMLEGPLLGKILLFTLPIIGSNILQTLFNTVDMIVVGHFEGDIALGAVGTCGSLINLILSLFIGLSLGAGVCVSVALGARKGRDVSQFVHTGMTTAAIAGVLVALIGFFGAPVFLSWMNLEGELLRMATQYIRVYFLGAPAVTIYNFGYAIMRSLGDTRRPLVYILIAGVANAGFNLLFVAVFGLGVIGVALGTIISLATSATLIVLSLCRYRNDCRLTLRGLGISRRHLLEILRIGIPSGIRGALFGLSNTMLQSATNSLGDIATAGNAAASSIESFLYISVSGYAATSAAFVGQNYGAGNHRRLRRVTFLCTLLSILTGVVVGVSFILLRAPLVALYLPEGGPSVAFAYQRILVVFSFYLFEGFFETLGGALQGIKVMIKPTLSTILCICVLRLAWIFFLFPLEPFHSIGGLYLCYPVSWFLNTVVHLLLVWYSYPRVCPKEPLPA